MNIFILHKNIQKKGAQYNCDQHVVKMILESVQMLCAALNKKTTPYKPTSIFFTISAATCRWAWRI
jgi:hypothetical protein